VRPAFQAGRCPKTMPGVTTFCPVTWCNNPLDGTNLTILICFQRHQMTMVPAPLTVLNSEHGFLSHLRAHLYAFRARVLSSSDHALHTKMIRSLTVHDCARTVLGDPGHIVPRPGSQIYFMEVVKWPPKNDPSAGKTIRWW
jgi:hypothetical protein